MIPLTPNELARWQKTFACRTPERIRVENTSCGFQCRGCSGACGTSHFELEPKIQQAEMFTTTQLPPA